MTRPPGAPPPFTTSIRLPSHRLDLDEARFLALLTRTFCLTKADKRHLLLTFPRLTQRAVDSLLETCGQRSALCSRGKTPPPPLSTPSGSIFSSGG